jgi:hypothetical protein
MAEHFLSTLSAATAIVLARRSRRALTAGLAGGLTLMYMVILPSLILGKITLQALRYITPVEFVFSVLMGSALSLILVMNLYGLRRTKACSRRAVALSIVAGVVPNSLCCTTVIPAVIGFFTISTSVLFTVSPAIQAFLARYAVAFYFVSFLSLLYSLQLISRSIASAESGNKNAGG